VFRVYAWDENSPRGENPFKYFSGGDAGPAYFWNYSLSTDYGLRNKTSPRGGPYGDNYRLTTPEGFPRSLVNSSASLNYTADTVGQAPGGSTPLLVDKLNGGHLSDSLGQTVTHEQLYGSPSSNQWTKLAFYVKMNSAVDVADGVISNWVDDQRVLHNTNMPWVQQSDIGMVKWNIIAIGGNDHLNVTKNGMRSMT